MTVDHNDTDERQARLDAMIEEFRAAQQRRLIKRHISRWTCTSAAADVTEVPEPPPAEKLN